MRIYPPARCPLGLFCLALFFGCTDSKPGQSDAVVPRWHGQSELAIGSLEGEHDQFADISGITSDQAGRVFVADAGNNTVVVFDSTGRYLYNIGRKGSGPGELNGPCCLAIDPAGLLWVRDAFNGRYNLYSIGDAQATLAATRKMSAGAGGLRTALTFDRDAHLVDVVMRTDQDRMRLFRFHVDSMGTASTVDTLLVAPNDSLGIYQFSVGNGIGFINQPYGPRFLVAHAPGGGYAGAISSRYLVTWVMPGATPARRTIRRDMIGPALSARERAVGDSTLQEDAKAAGQAPASLPFGVPGAKTPVRTIMFDRQGRLWVQLNVGDGENSRADVWDSTGRRVGNAEWPAGVDLRQGFINDRVAYGVQQDSAGVPQVVRIRFR